MNVDAALLMIDFVCQHRHSEPLCNDHIRKEMLFAISELADSCLEAVQELENPTEWDKCLTEISLVSDFVEEGLQKGDHELAFSQIQGVSLRAVPSPGDTQSPQ